MWAGGDYEAVGGRIAGIAEQVVAAVDRRRPLTGAAVVDLACGTGSAALAAAARGASVTAVDITPELLTIGEAKAAGRGYQIDWRRGDAAATGLPSGCMAAAVSNMGLIFVEPHAQVAEVTRLLEPDGVLGFSAWRRMEVNPLLDPITAVLGLPERSYSPDEWGEAATATARLSATFSEIQVVEGTLAWSFESLAGAMRFIVAESPMHVTTVAGAGGKRDELLAAFETALAAHAMPDGQVSFAAPYVVITARRQATPR